MIKPYIIKIGSNVLRAENGTLDHPRLSHLVQEISLLRKNGHSIVLVSSGAVASGRSLFPHAEHLDSISQRQLWASIGQVKLIQTYSDEFSKQQLITAQVLVTKEDFRDRSHYLNMKNCFTTLLENGVIPIVNENDVISVTELMFTDNDELAGLVASMLDAQKLIILSNVNGVYSGNPNDPNSELIPEIAFHENLLPLVVAPVKSSFGRGGMLTKFNMARKTAGLGIPVQIANGKTDFILSSIFANQAVGTTFLAKKKTSTTKKWLAHANSAFAGSVVIDDGAKRVLQSDNPTSLLPIGIIKVDGNFKKGDIIRIDDLKGNVIGLGKSAYDSETARELMGKKNQKECIHYDYLYLNPS
jgi:glutamate 5-kinase